LKFTSNADDDDHGTEVEDQNQSQGSSKAWSE